MSTLTFVEKESISNFFSFKNGYVFSSLDKRYGYNKTKTRDLIFEATGIDIYSNPEYDMSQERCIRKIWEDCDDYTVGKLLKTMLDYYVSISDWSWDWSEQNSYEALRRIEERLLKNNVSVPQTDNESLEMLRQDIERNIANNTPEMAVDRLHTFCVKYLKELCDKHGVAVNPDSDGHYALVYLGAELSKWYKSNEYFDSDFSLTAIRNSISLFDKFNYLRNNRSPAHDNDFLFKTEAEYVVKVISDTIAFIDKIEKVKDIDLNDNVKNEKLPWEDENWILSVPNEELPF